MRPAALTTILIVVLLLATIPIGVLAAPSTVNPADRSLAEITEPRLIYDISLDEQGNAVWNISAQFPVTDEQEEEAFAAIAQTFQENSNDGALGISVYEMAASELSDVLDREMTIENVDRVVSESDDRGELTLTFEWTAFAQATDGNVTVGDVFTSGERTWFSLLRENEHLRIHAPPNHAIETSGMPVSDRTVWIDGPAELNADSLRTVFVPESQLTEGSDNDEEPLSAFVLPALAGAGLAVLFSVALFGIAYWLKYQPVVSAVTSVAGATESDVDDDPEGEPEEGAENEASPEISLLSDEERVLALIEENGGRMKQAAIVTETDWSNAKVSQLLSEMAETGEIEKLRIGRENLISLPEEENE